MKVERPLLVLDLESTGVDPVKDRIIELAIVALRPDGTIRQACQRFNPGIPIPAGATAVHGITDADVAGCPPFADLAGRIHGSLKGCDLAGYNLRRMDLPMLDEEFRRCGLKLELEGVRILDAFAIFQKKHPRDLAAAMKVYCGVEYEDAHGALADASATLAVLQSQLQQYEELGAMKFDDLHLYCARREDGTRPADLAGKLYWNADDELCFNFGEKRGVRVVDDVGFAQWILRKDFPGSTKEMILSELNGADPVLQ